MERLTKWCMVFILCANLAFANEAGQQITDEILQKGEQKIADQIYKILDHYKQDDPIGVPGVEIPDPLDIPPQSKKISFVQMEFTNMKVYGLSKFKLKKVTSELSQMKATAIITISKLDVIGNYTAKYFFKNAKGPFTIQITDLQVEGLVTLGVEIDGKLRARDIEIDFSNDKVDMNFQNLGIMGTVLQGVMNSASTLLINSIKPFVLDEAYEKIRLEVNNNLDKVAGDLEFPNSISPLDMVIADTRQKIRQMKIDPYIVKDYNYSSGFYKAEVAHTWILGISSFYRVGNISMYVENNTLFADFEVGTQKLTGETQWQLSMVGGMLSRSGSASFSVEYIKARIIIAQSLDTRKHPIFKDLDLDMGNIQVRCDGAGTLDYVVELVINILPNILRYQILDGVEGPIKNKVQEEFNKVNVEEEIKKRVATLDSTNMEDFKLSSLKNFG